MADTRNDLDVSIGVSLTRLAAQLSRAEARFVAATRKIERETNAGTQRAADQMAANYGRGIDRVNAQTERLNDSVRRMNAQFAGGRGGVQNVSYQIQDFAVQVSAGTAATVALGQQLPQLLGGFGPWGAVIGAATAILLPLAGALLLSDERAESAEDAIKTFSASVDDYVGYVRIATTGTAELLNEFGAWAGEVRSFAEFMAGVAIDQSMSDMSAALGPLSADLTNVVDAVVAWENAEAALARAQQQQLDGMASASDVALYADTLETMRDAAEQAASQLGLTTDRAVILNDAIQRMNDAEGMHAVAAAAANVASHLERWFPAGSGMTAEMRALSVHINEILSKTSAAAVEADAMRIGFQDAAAAGQALHDALSVVASAADGAAASVGRIAMAAWEAARALAQVEINRQYRVANLALGDDERGGSTGHVSNYISQQLADEARARYGSLVPGGVSPTDGGGRDGGGGAARDIAAEFARLLAQLDPVVRATQEFEAAQTLINEALGAGAATAEEAAAAYKLAEERFTEATGAVEDGTSAWRDFEAAGASALDRLIEGTGDWRDVLIDAMREFAIAQARAALLTAMPGADQNASLGTLLMQGITGWFPGGTSGSVPPAAAVGAPAAVGRLSGGAAPKVVVNNAVGNAQANARVSGNADVGYMIEVAVQEKMAQGRFDRPMSRYGARPAKVVR